MRARRLDICDLDEGRFIVERPDQPLGAESIEYLEVWLELLLRKIKMEPAQEINEEPKNDK